MTTSSITVKPKPVDVKQMKVAASDHLHHLAFDNSLLANIISTGKNGRIIKANMAACKLLGYSKKELLTKARKDIFRVSESNHIEMLKKRTAEGHAKADVKMIKRNGRQVPCEVTSVIFVGDHGIETSITTIVDVCQTALKKKDKEIRRLDAEIRLKTSQFADAVSEARDQERSELGKELHDNINQLLSVSKLFLEMGRNEGPNKEMYLNRSSEYTMNAIEEIRKLTRGMISNVIKDVGLCEAIDTMIRDTMEIHPVKIFFTHDNLIERRLNDKFRLTLFRIIQEQLNNILKHAWASVVNIGLSQNKKSTILYISDNGIGFDTAKKTNGIGIRNIKTRARGYKGNTTFTTEPGKGCVLTISFPFFASSIESRQAVLL